MNLRQEVLTVMRQSENALTVNQVTAEVAERMKDEVREILNALAEEDELSSVHGGGGYQTYYRAKVVRRRA
jgi:Fe2+ or Zn2+ uptake regulation protein